VLVVCVLNTSTNPAAVAAPRAMVRHFTAGRAADPFLLLEVSFSVSHLWFPQWLGERRVR
jgi:hypothetical protein